ncbi:hypothetical protein Hanom_Chr06g00559501 [Helianthus anomalus]
MAFKLINITKTWLNEVKDVFVSLSTLKQRKLPQFQKGYYFRPHCNSIQT